MNLSFCSCSETYVHIILSKLNYSKLKRYLPKLKEPNLNLVYYLSMYILGVRIKFYESLDSERPP